MPLPTPPKPVGPPIIEVRDLAFHYAEKQALFDIQLQVPANQVTAFIGPSGCGKSTLLRCFNRINDRIPDARISGGEVIIKGKNINDEDVDLAKLRRQVGMIFQKYNPFPKSIYENVVYGLRIAGVKKKDDLDNAAEHALRKAALWDETKDRLRQNAFGLSGGQLQRLCIARAIAVNPDILLMDEPCSALDPIATLKIEELITQLAEHHTIVIVTHNMQQAARVSQRTAFFYLGRLVECNDTKQLFSQPEKEETERYLSGRVG